MHEKPKIAINFLFLALLALLAFVIDGLADFWGFVENHHYRNPIPEVQYELRQHRSVCPEPELGKLQTFMDCHNKLYSYRKDI